MLSHCPIRASQLYNAWSETVSESWDSKPVPTLQNPWSEHCPTVPVYTHSVLGRDADVFTFHTPEEDPW